MACLGRENSVGGQLRLAAESPVEGGCTFALLTSQKERARLEGNPRAQNGDSPACYNVFFVGKSLGDKYFPF